ncbi:MAG: hypothetical protein K6A45_10905 [Lachnospiraceae bacterium]|nr:hypothetical protein [Lachnospiraceae bacterium]
MFAKIVRQKAFDNEVTYTSIAKKCGWTCSQLSSKLKLDRMNETEMLKIAEALGYELEIRLVSKPEIERRKGERRQA